MYDLFNTRHICSVDIMHYLIGVDLSEYSEKAFRTLLKIYNAEHDTITLVHSIEPSLNVIAKNIVEVFITLSLPLFLSPTAYSLDSFVRGLTSKHPTSSYWFDTGL